MVHDHADTPAGKLLTELESRQDDAILQLGELEARIESLFESLEIELVESHDDEKEIAD
ncbi:MAG: hypothetical protein AAF539_14815 [Planctomycetota bacterium]